jgi:hypothetical protein
MDLSLRRRVTPELAASTGRLREARFGLARDDVMMATYDDALHRKIKNKSFSDKRVGEELFLVLGKEATT